MDNGHTTESHALTTTPPRTAAPLDVIQVGELLAKSGYFKDVRDMAQAVTKILAGQELGLGAIASLKGVYIDQFGKIAYAATAIAAAIKGHPRYNFTVKQLDATGCVLTFFEQGVKVGESAFTLDDAKTAGLLDGPNKATWARYPRNMLFARALTNGQKWYAPDVGGGMALYTPEELGAPVSGEGEVLAAPREMLDVTPAPQSIESTSPSPEDQAAAILRRSRSIFATFREGGFSEAVIRDYMRMRLAKDSTKTLTDEEAALLRAEVKDKTVQKWVELGSPTLTDAPFLSYFAVRFDPPFAGVAQMNTEQFRLMLVEIEDGTVEQFLAVPEERVGK